MLKAFTLENFKGVQKPVRIEFHSITLLFGPNSAGKSTVLHGLHYANEIFQRGNTDPGRTLWGGDSVHLGGFETIVHGYDLGRSINLKFEVGLEDAIFEQIDVLEDLVDLDSPTDATVRLEVRWNPDLRRPVIVSFTIQYDGVDFASMESSLDGRQIYLNKLNTEHPVFGTQDGSDLAQQLEELMDEFRLPEKWGVDGLFQIPLSDTNGALPDLDRALGLNIGWGENDDVVRSALNTLIMLPLLSIREALKQFTYIGPLRQTPSRNYTPARFVQSDRWASGLAAWDALYHAEKTLVDRTSTWMSAENRLNTGYEIERERMVEISEFVRDSLVKGEILMRAIKDLAMIAQPKTSLVLRDTRNDVAVQPHDVGVGISQLIPIVVGALYKDTGMLAVEQPEIHVHPALQVRLGDLFISQTKQGKQFLIETHSEQLLLRLLRRIRETFEGELDDQELHFEPDGLGVYFTTMSEHGGTQILKLPVDETGDIKEWPEGFFDERAEELF